ncbi:MAG: monovalent cation/H+ antiporter subunit D family protein [Betaproteobacteria bacterium]|nr:monovalent cation/H+ antiporter subunit D family protein [Betaproteobacteria bacterium]
MILDHLPALQVVLPLISAPVIVLVRRSRFAWLMAVAVSWVAAAIAVMLAIRVADAGVISYALGNWQPPWGIEYRVDPLSAFVLVLVAGTAAIVAPFSRISVVAELPREQEYLLYAMFCLCLAGLLGITITGDVFNLFVFLEISSLSTYVMVALGQKRQALAAAYRYLIMGTIAATFYVIGIGMLYLMTGTLNMADLSVRLADVTDVRPILAAFAFITVGIGLKLALFPLHQWLPNAYTFAPSAVTAFLGATATKVSIYVLLRFYFTVFGTTLLFRAMPTDQVLMLLSLLGAVTASLVAVFQKDIKRMFAYSSVGQVGYITLGISLANTSGLTAAVVHLLNHAVTKGAIFILIAGITLRTGGASGFDRLKGIGSRMPFTSFGIVIGGLSLIGVPGTAGFVSKWYLVLGAIQRGEWIVAAVVLASSLIAAAYVWKFVETAYLTKPDESSVKAGEAPLPMLAFAWFMVVLCVFLGLDTSLSVGGARAAADFLLGGLR